MHRTGGRDRLHRWVAADPSAYRSSQACCDGTTKVPDLMENSVPARPVYVRGKTHIGTCDEDRRTQHRILIPIVLQPSEELRNAIDLIIVTTVWKRQKLGEEVAEPRRAVRQVDVTCLNLRRLGRHSIDFAALRLDADRTRHSFRH